MTEIITLSRGREQNVSTIEATFKYNGELIPLKVSEQDRPGVFSEINELLKTPNLDFDKAAVELFGLMSPEAKVRKSIEDSHYLSRSLSIVGGTILFNGEKLEDTLANHMLSLLNEENAPKDEKMWRSYVKFLDNLFQNANCDIRNQLFRWMEYETRAGNAFGITEDGCLVGYKGCQGTVFEPMSKFTGNAIVDGVEFSGHIPNKVGSVIQMPRSAVTADPSIGCSYGLHVGTRDYAAEWAPILILVKVNPRDVVSVPYECDSQKMRVCEYTVIEVTNVSDEHKFFHGDESDSNRLVLDADEIYDSLESNVYVEYGEKSVEGELKHLLEDGITLLIVQDKEGQQHLIGFDEITHFESDYSPDEDEDEDEDDYKMSTEEAVDLLTKQASVEIIRDDGERYEGVVVDVYIAPGKEPGVIINDEGKYSHIKLHRIHFWY